MPAKRVPVIDIKPLADRSPRHDDTITAIEAACREYGLFHITGHGIPSDLIERVGRLRAEMRRQEEEEHKQRSAMNQRS